MSSNIKPKSRLVEEILTGQLLLKGDSLVRYNFSLSVGEFPIGIYGIRSFGEKKLRAIRSWNNSVETWDPFRKLYIPTFGKQFYRIRQGFPLFLVEYNQAFDTVTDKVAFKAGKVLSYSSLLGNMPEHMRFEEIDFEEIEILG